MRHSLLRPLCQCLTAHYMCSNDSIAGGTAGLLVVNRRASTPTRPTVLVLEAGGDHSSSAYRNPSLRYMLAFTNPELDHGYVTVPKTALGERTIPYLKGKGRGYLLD